MDREVERKRLIDQLCGWWVGNGWNPSRLENMPLEQLLAIRQRAINSKWAIKLRPRVRGQGTLVDK